MRPVFVITIDAEGDRIWNKPRLVTTENARFLPRFQQLCELYGFNPICLTNCAMAVDKRFQEFARPLLNRGLAEVGAHVHAWNSLAEDLHIENAVEILEPVDHTQLGKYYAEADVFVLASRREGMPLALLEAMAYARPVIATRVGGIPELIRDGNDGLLIEPGESSKLAEYLETLYRDKRLREQLASNAHELSSRISWDVIARRYFMLFERELRSPVHQARYVKNS